MIWGNLTKKTQHKGMQCKLRAKGLKERVMLIPRIFDRDERSVMEEKKVKNCELFTSISP